VITGEQARAAYDALGLDPDRYTMTESIELAANKLTVYRIRSVPYGPIREVTEVWIKYGSPQLVDEETTE